MKSEVPSTPDISASRGAREIFKKRKWSTSKKSMKWVQSGNSGFCSFIGLKMADKTVKTYPQLFLSAIMLANSGTRAHLFVKKYTKTVSQRDDWKY